MEPFYCFPTIVYQIFSPIYFISQPVVHSSNVSSCCYFTSSEKKFKQWKWKVIRGVLYLTLASSINTFIDTHLTRSFQPFSSFMNFVRYSNIRNFWGIWSLIYQRSLVQTRKPTSFYEPLQSRNRAETRYTIATSFHKTFPTRSPTSAPVD